MSNLNYNYASEHSKSDDQKLEIEDFVEDDNREEVMHQDYEEQEHNDEEITNYNQPASNEYRNNLRIHSNQEPIYIMTLELEKGMSTNIHIYQDSNSEQLASDFCEEYGLPEDSYRFLKEEIENLMINYFAVKNQSEQERFSRQIREEIAEVDETFSDCKVDQDMLSSKQTEKSLKSDTPRSLNITSQISNSNRNNVGNEPNQVQGDSNNTNTLNKENPETIDYNIRVKTANPEVDEKDESSNIIVEKEKVNNSSLQKTASELSKDKEQNLRESNLSSEGVLINSTEEMGYADAAKREPFEVARPDAQFRPDERQNTLLEEYEDNESLKRESVNKILGNSKANTPHSQANEAVVMRNNAQSDIYTLSSSHNMSKDKLGGFHNNLEKHLKNKNAEILEKPKTEIEYIQVNTTNQSLQNSKRRNEALTQNAEEVTHKISSKVNTSNNNTDRVEDDKMAINEIHEEKETNLEYNEPIPDQISIRESNNNIKSKSPNLFYYQFNTTKTQGEGKGLTARDYIIQKQTAKETRTSNISIFERLYKEAEFKRKLNKPLSSHTMKNESSSEKIIDASKSTAIQITNNRSMAALNKSSNPNIGHELYSKGVYAMEMKKSEIAKLRKEIEDEEQQFCTFKPSTNRSRTGSKHKYAVPSSNYNNFDSKTYFAHKSKKIKLLQSRIYDDQLKSCTYSPQITKYNPKIFPQSSKSNFETTKPIISLQVTNNSQVFNNQNNELNRDMSRPQLSITHATIRNSKPNTIDANSSYNINNSNFQLFNLQPHEKKESSQTKVTYDNRMSQNFLDRQKDYDKYQADRMNQLRQKHQSPELTYEPNLNLSKPFRQISPNSSAASGFAKTASKSQTSMFIPEKISNEKIFEKVKIETFKCIFRVLDSDGDDYISSRFINCQRLMSQNHKVMRILSPLIKEIYEDNESLNCQEFVASMTELFKVRHQ